MNTRSTRIGALLVLILALAAMPVYAVREGIAIDAQEDVWLYRGADFVMYSDNHVSPVFSVDGATGYMSNPGAGGIYMDDDVEINGSLTVTELVSQSITLSAADDLESTDDLRVGDDAAITGDLLVTLTSDLRGNVSDGGGTFTIADDVLIDGQADAVQLTVQGHSTQTSKPFVVETSAGTDQFTVSNTGDVALLGALSQTQVNAASGSANPFDYTGTLGIMNGSDDFTLFDVNITNADHTSTGNTVQALDIAGITADAHATESAVKFGAGWDSDINGVTSLELASDDVVVVTVKDPAAIDSAATNEIVEIAGTTPADTTGTNTHNFLTVDAAIGNASGGTNVATGVQVDGITGDAQVTENGVNVGSGWDYGVVSASPVQINSTLKVTGAVNSLMDVMIVTTDTVLTAADSGTYVIANNAGTFQNTITLPAAAAGLNFCLMNGEGDDLELDAAAGDQIFTLTSDTGEEVDNSTVNNFLCVVAGNDVLWYTYGVDGTWSDD